MWLEVDSSRDPTSTNKDANARNRSSADDVSILERFQQQDTRSATKTTYGTSVTMPP
jgi:hypothetical protein